MRNDSDLETLRNSLLVELAFLRARHGSKHEGVWVGFLFWGFQYYGEPQKIASPVGPLTKSVVFIQHLPLTPAS